MMKHEDQVVSLKLAKVLKLLGVKQDSLFYYLPVRGLVMKGSWYTEEMPNIISAFTVAELGELLKNEPYCLPGFNGIMWYMGSEDIGDGEGYNTEVEARAQMLISLLENDETLAGGTKTGGLI